MNDQTKAPELLPCPFCGGWPEARFEDNKHSDDGHGSVRCGDCCAATTGSYCGWTSDKEDRQASITEAVEAWNTRADIAAEQVREAYERGLEDAARVADVKPRRGGRPLSGPHHGGIRAGRAEAARLIRAMKSGGALEQTPSPGRAVASEAAWQDVTALPDPKEGPFMVSNLPNAVNSHGRPSHVFCVGSIHKDEDGSFCAFDGYKKIWGVTRYYPISSPALPQETANDQ